MDDLPHVIFDEILSSLSDGDKLSLALVNVRIAKLILKQVRLIQIYSNVGVKIPKSAKKKQKVEDRLRSYLTSKKFRETIDNLIYDPSLNIKLRFPGKGPFKVDCNDAITCLELETTADILTELLIHHVKKVHRLKLEYVDYGRESLKESQLSLIAEWIANNPQLLLKEFYLSNYDFTHLPAIPSLESLFIENSLLFQINGLQIPSYSHLRVLRLSWCESIEDVSCLDNIHELYLLNCNKIYNITSLHHNYKIVIENCYKIEDYSSSFYYSKFIKIRCPTGSKVNFNFSKLLEVREIDIGAQRNGNIIRSIEFPRCLSLRSIIIEDMELPSVILPENNLRKIAILSCTSITSFVNFNRIYSVVLYNLNITSLEGIGGGNRVVEVSQCPLLTDFRALRSCDKVIISYCEGFRDISQLRGLQSFAFTPCDVSDIPNDLEGVTCLTLGIMPENLLSVPFPKTLSELVLGGDTSYLIPKEFPALIDALPPQIDKIQVTTLGTKVNDFRLMQKNGEFSFLNFTIEFKNGVIFLRIRNEVN